MPNNDYILRSNALKAIRYKNWREENRVPSIEGLHLTEYQLLAEAINSIPAADVEPVRHGRWDYRERLVGFTEIWSYECSECMYETVDNECYELPKYCPNCGAKMDAEPPKEEENAD